MTDPMGDRLEQARKSLEGFEDFLARIRPTYNYDRNIKELGEQIESVLKAQHGILVILEHEIAELKKRDMT